MTKHPYEITKVKQFEIGKQYSARSICDSDTVFTFTILKRSAKFITIKAWGEEKRVGIYEYDGAEQARPLGNYSMCPIIRA
jgi:hypothetical protein